jgi:hypothetical protein
MSDRTLAAERESLQAFLYSCEEAIPQLEVVQRLTCGRHVEDAPLLQESALRRTGFPGTLQRLHDEAELGIWRQDGDPPPKPDAPDLEAAQQHCRDLIAWGKRAMARLEKNGQPLKPRWDKHNRALWYGETRCRQFKKAAPQQETILDAFEEEGWPQRIDDPLAPGKLPDTIKSLQEGLPSAPITFERDGTGKGIVWRERQPDNP